MKTVTINYNKSYSDLIPTQGHLLLAGATGSGKSVILNGIINAICATQSAELALCDPKRVELSPWNKCNRVTMYGNDVNSITHILDTSICAMRSRYEKMEKQGVKLWEGHPIYIIIDELADLMLTNKKETLPRLQRLAQLGRASRIHLIVATQAPSRHVIPAELTLNFTNRLALRCVSAIESKQIIQTKGAETLPRHGEGLLLSPNGLQRINLPMVTDADIKDTINKLHK